MLGFLGGKNIMGALEGVAKEWIETSGEKAEAKALMVKTLDPNGLMRRQLSQTVTTLYSTYIIVLLVLVLVQAFGLSPLTPSGALSQNGEPIMIQAASLAIDAVTELFLPITGSFTAIIGASFGTNMYNIKKNKK